VVVYLEPFQFTKLLEEKYLEVKRTARYYVYGKLSEETEQLWFVLHGYGMLASHFIKDFEDLDSSKHVVIAPEGLSRFYWNGFGGKPVASWMTSEDRLNEIADYVAYLRQLFALHTQNLPNPNIRTNVLGFSQGTATAARWLAQETGTIHNMIFWAGPLPEDVEWDKARPIFNAANVYFVLGKQDEFITEERYNSHKEKLQNLGFDYEFIGFEGKHRIDSPTLLALAERFV